MPEATYFFTSVLGMAGSIIKAADPLFNPLNANASILTYIVDFGVGFSLAVGAIGMVLRLGKKRR